MTVSTDPRKTGITNGPSVLAQSGVPVVLPSSGSSNATGQITLTTALVTIPVGTVGIYLPAGVVTGGSQGSGAGVYQANFSSTTVCQLTGTGITTGNAAYTQTTASDLTLATVTLPGGALGANGKLRVNHHWGSTNTAGTKNPKVFLSTTAFAQGVNGSSWSTQASARCYGEIQNCGSASAQMSLPFSGASGGSTSAPQRSTHDTNADQTIAIKAQINTATDWMILEGYTFEVLSA